MANHIYMKYILKNKEITLKVKPVSYTHLSLWKSYIVSDFYKQGQLAGEWLRDYLEKEDRLDKNIDVVQLKEHFTYLAQEERNEGFKDAINSLNNIDIIAKEIESKNVTVTKEYFIKLAEYLRNNNIDVLYTCLLYTSRCV